MSLGKRLKRERELRGWSQLFVAEKISISNTVLSNYERDYRDPDTDTLRLLAELYEVSTDYLLGKPNNLSDFHQRIVDRVNSKPSPQISEDLPEVQFIMRAKEEMSPKAYAKFIKLVEQAKKAFDEEDDD